jgi:murein DD-endopeptidase MepM/ murein hydrolase activator NlpD
MIARRFRRTITRGFRLQAEGQVTRDTSHPSSFRMESRRWISQLACALLSTLVSASAPPPVTVTAAARAIRPGELVVLTISTPAPAASAQVHAFDRDWIPFRVDARTWRVLVGIDLDVAPGSHAVGVTVGSGATKAATTYPLVVTPRAFRTRRLTVAQAFVTPPPEMADRIQQEALMLQQLWRSSAPERLWEGAFVRPVPDPANSAFGTRSVFNGQARSPHGGADFDSPAGRPIKAPNAGRIALARALYFTGNTVVIDHGLGLFSLFAHLSTTDVREGDSIARGEGVGTVGATGRVTGPHLHWTVRAGDARVDPLSLLDVLGVARERSRRAR